MYFFAMMSGSKLPCLFENMKIGFATYMYTHKITSHFTLIFYIFLKPVTSLNRTDLLMKYICTAVGYFLTL